MMDPNACGETAVQIYTVVENRLTAAGFDAMMEVNKIEIFREAMKLYITNVIGQHGSGAGSQPKAASTSKPSEKQLALARQLGCEKPETFSKKDLSVWIDENKDW